MRKQNVTTITHNHAYDILLIDCGSLVYMCICALIRNVIFRRFCVYKGYWSIYHHCSRGGGLRVVFHSKLNGNTHRYIENVFPMECLLFSSFLFIRQFPFQLWSLIQKERVLYTSHLFGIFFGWVKPILGNVLWKYWIFGFFILLYVFSWYCLWPCLINSHMFAYTLFQWNYDTR